MSSHVWNVILEMFKVQEQDTVRFHLNTNIHLTLKAGFFFPALAKTKKCIKHIVTTLMLSGSKKKKKKILTSQHIKPKVVSLNALQYNVLVNMTVSSHDLGTHGDEHRVSLKHEDMIN